MLGTLLARIKGWSTVILSVLSAILVAFLYGRRKGHGAASKDAQAQRTLDQNKALQGGLDAVAERNHVEDKIASRTDSTSAERLRKHWSRD